MSTWLDEQDPTAVAEGLRKYEAQDTRFDSVRSYVGDDERFGLWLALAETWALTRLATSIFDIGDWLWRDAYENGQSPSEAAHEAFSEDDLFGSLLFDVT